MKNNCRVVINRFGSPEVLEPIWEALPQPKGKEVRVKMLTAGVSFADVMARQGKYPLAPKSPFTPGYEFVGEVDEIGEQVTGFQVGDRVVGLNPALGSYTDYFCISADFLVTLPKRIDTAKACSLGLNYLTAYNLLFTKANVKKGQTVLVHSAAGGVGTALIELAKLSGVNVLGTASASKHGLVRKLGAEPIDYQSDDFVQVIQSKHPNGIDAAFDARGGRHLHRTLQTVKEGGIVVSYGFAGDSYGGLSNMLKGIAQVGLYNLLPNGKRVQFCAVPAEAKKDVSWYKGALSELVKLLDGGKIDPIIEQTFSLQNAAQAHALLESGTSVGKIVLQAES